jgi:hypothetical protein
MHPAFRSNKSALAFCALLIVLLALPVILSWIGPPSRKEAFSSISNQAGPVGYETKTIYDDPRDADVLLVGSSMIRTDLQPERIESALSAHLGRPAHVALLAMSWPGVDSQYYMLRDYLEHHHATLIVWNQPQANAFNNEPHVQSYHWVRYGQYNDAWKGLPPLFRVYLYAEMVLGAPRELLSMIRPNLIGPDEQTQEANAVFVHADPERKVGYNGAPFVPDTAPVGSAHEKLLLPLSSPEVAVTGPYPGKYQIHYMREFAKLAQQHHSEIVFLHLPQAFEYGDTTIPELASWPKILGRDYQLIGAPAGELFPGVSRERYLHFYLDDNHLNNNGEAWITDKITPSILEAYDEAAKGVSVESAKSR